MASFKVSVILDTLNHHSYNRRADQAPTDGTAYLRSRIGHSMLLNAKSNQLYIFAGQRHKDYLSDFYIYDISTDSVIEMSRDSSKNGGPDAGFTQRATIDGELEEFYVFSGLMREKNSTTETVKNSLWVYSIRKDLWQRIYQNENMSEEYWRGMGTIEPCPRFAHQLVYDSKRKVRYYTLCFISYSRITVAVFVWREPGRLVKCCAAFGRFLESAAGEANCCRDDS